MPIARGIMTLSACTRGAGVNAPTFGDRRDQSNQWLGDLAYHVPRALVRALRVRCRITRPSRDRSSIHLGSSATGVRFPTGKCACYGWKTANIA